jgi:hypothetical protein
LKSSLILGQTPLISTCLHFSNFSFFLFLITTVLSFSLLLYPFCLLHLFRLSVFNGVAFSFFFPQSLSLVFSSLSLYPKLFICLSSMVSLSLSIFICLSVCLSHFLSLSFKHAHTLFFFISLSLSRSFPLTHTLSLYLS